MGHGWAARTGDPIPPGRDTTSAHKRDGLRRRDLRRKRGPAVQRLLHYQTEGHGYGALDLPFDRGRPRWPAVGHGQRATRCHVSVHPAGERSYCVVRLCPQKASIPTYCDEVPQLVLNGAISMAPRSLRSRAIALSFGEGGRLRCHRMISKNQDDAFAVIGVAILIAVGELRPDLSQIARPDRLTAQRTDRLAP